MEAKIDKFRLGRIAREKGVEIYTKKYGGTRKLEPMSKKSDYMGGDDLETIMNDSSTYVVDWKNNHDSYLFQYNRKAGRASVVSNYTIDCITQKIYIYDERTNSNVITELMMDEYWSKYFVDVRLVPSIKLILKAFEEEDCSEREYFKKVEAIKQSLKYFVKDNVIIDRAFEDTKDMDYKLRLIIKK